MKFFQLTGSLVIALLYPANALAVQPMLVPEKAVAAPVQNNTSAAMPPVAPAAINPPSIAPAPNGQSVGLVPPTVPSNSSSPTTPDGYPLIGRMETITFGQTKPSETVENRLTHLEQAVFRIDYKNESLFDRTQRLKLAILGANDPGSENQELDFASLPPLQSRPDLTSSAYLGGLLLSPPSLPRLHPLLVTLQGLRS